MTAPELSPSEIRTAISEGRTSLGIELGSTRIKACLVLSENPSVIIATGSHEWENQLVDGLWTYSLDDVWAGVQESFARVSADVSERYQANLVTVGALGVSAMMHGYLAFDDRDELLVPFRTWRNTSTGPAAAELSQLFDVNIPLRWSVAHWRQAMRDGEAHVSDVRFVTTLSGYVHWQLSGERVLGVGDASGMFPIDAVSQTYDAGMRHHFDELVASEGITTSLAETFPRVVMAGDSAGALTPRGAALLDPTGMLSPGVPMCAPEGDAGTGMVATGAIAPRTGNVSAGTSIFAMVVLERPLAEAHEELDLVMTPSGDPVAMVHCNNGASELSAWVGLFSQFAAAAGAPMAPDDVYATLFAQASHGAPDAGGLLAYNQLAGEPLAHLIEGRPLFVRTPDSAFTLANFMRAQIYGVFATLSLGMAVLAKENVAIDTMYAHGGIFRTPGVAQGMLAASLNAPVAVAESASEGGAWGIAVLAAYATSSPRTSLDAYLREVVFGADAFEALTPTEAEVSGFADYLRRYEAGLAAERAAIEAL